MTRAGDSSCDVLVIGAGAAGLFCAATAGERGRRVVVIDHAARPGAKVRISGGGRCNFTNRAVDASRYLSENPHFCKSALARFPPRELLALVEGHGIRYHEREDGQLFCDTSAREIAAMLESRCRAAGVALRLGAAIEALEGDGACGFRVRTAQGLVRAAALVVATGGLSYPKLGASGLGFDLARRFGLRVVPPRPALVPFVLAAAERPAFGALAGVSLDASIAAGGVRRAGRLLFTHRGLSGPVALQASLRWRPGEALSVDLAPGRDALAALLARRRGGTAPATALAELLPKRLARAWCARAGLARPLDQIPERELRALAAGLHDWRLVPGGTEGYATAEVTAGGVDTAGLSSATLEARAAPRLHFVGEVVDVTGELGGFNLHWAWASARAAGLAC